MKCPNCEDSKLDVVRVHSAGDRGEARDLRCRECGFKSSSVTFLVPRPQEHKKGLGGHALSKAIESGRLTLSDE